MTVDTLPTLLPAAFAWCLDLLRGTSPGWDPPRFEGRPTLTIPQDSSPWTLTWGEGDPIPLPMTPPVDRSWVALWTGLGTPGSDLPAVDLEGIPVLPDEGFVPLTALLPLFLIRRGRSLANELVYGARRGTAPVLVTYDFGAILRPGGKGRVSIRTQDVGVGYLDGGHSVTILEGTRQRDGIQIRPAIPLAEGSPLPAPMESWREGNKDVWKGYVRIEDPGGEAPTWMGWLTIEHYVSSALRGRVVFGGSGPYTLTLPQGFTGPLHIDARRWREARDERLGREADRAEEALIRATLLPQIEAAAAALGRHFAPRQNMDPEQGAAYAVQGATRNLYWLRIWRDILDPTPNQQALMVALGKQTAADYREAHAIAQRAIAALQAPPPLPAEEEENTDTDADPDEDVEQYARLALWAMDDDLDEDEVPPEWFEAALSLRWIQPLPHRPGSYTKDRSMAPTLVWKLADLEALVEAAEARDGRDGITLTKFALSFAEEGLRGRPKLPEWESKRVRTLQGDLRSHLRTIDPLETPLPKPGEDEDDPELWAKVVAEVLESRGNTPGDYRSSRTQPLLDALQATADGIAEAVDANLPYNWSVEGGEVGGLSEEDPWEDAWEKATDWLGEHILPHVDRPTKPEWEAAREKLLQDRRATIRARVTTLQALIDTWVDHRLGEMDHLLAVIRGRPGDHRVPQLREVYDALYRVLDLYESPDPDAPSPVLSFLAALREDVLDRSVTPKKGKRVDREEVTRIPGNALAGIQAGLNTGIRWDYYLDQLNDLERGTSIAWRFPSRS